jgi:hypothetical protein
MSYLKAVRLVAAQQQQQLAISVTAAATAARTAATIAPRQPPYVSRELHHLRHSALMPVLSAAMLLLLAWRRCIHAAISYNHLLCVLPVGEATTAVLPEALPE